MTRIEQLTKWVKSKHEGQLIRYTNEPYFAHLKFVAEKVINSAPFGYEVGLCHDLLEKTTTKTNELYTALIDFGYDRQTAIIVQHQVIELTNFFTKSNFPDLKKSVRKEKEEIRLAKISPDSQTVKYADLIYNVNWVIMYDFRNAKKYLKQKQQLLAVMDAGESKLHYEASLLISNSLANFKHP